MEYMFGFGSLLAGAAYLMLILWALVDAIKSANEPVVRLIWVLVILFMPLLGSLIYLAAGRKKKDTVKAVQ